MNSFSHMGEFHRIWVIGPQRSGTRIVAKMIAHDTFRDYVDETRFMVDSLHQLQNILAHKGPKKIVIHGPGISRWAHVLAGPSDSVVFCWRDLADVIKSQERWWTKDRIESIKYHRTHNSAEAKHEYWKTVQRSLSPNPVTLRYPEDIEDHPMYVPKNKRFSFAWDQTGVDE
jgi:hypothetical protein